MANLAFGEQASQLTTELDALQATGQPEIPRLVGHTLRLHPHVPGEFSCFRCAFTRD